MSKKASKNRGPEKWLSAVDAVALSFPHLSGWFSDEESFREIRVQLRNDGSCLSIAKGYASDGGPVVCFGSGYGLIGSLLALDASIQGGNWREDKPWTK